MYLLPVVQTLPVTLVGIDCRPRVLDIKSRSWLKWIDSNPINFLPEGFSLIYVDGLWMDSMRSTVCLFVWLKTCYVFCLFERYRCVRHVTGLRIMRSAWKLKVWKPQDNKPRKRLRCMWVILQCILKSGGRSLSYDLVQKTSRDQSKCVWENNVRMGPRGIGCEIVTELNCVNIEPLCMTWLRSPVFLYKQDVSWTLIRQPTLKWKPCTVKLGMPRIPADQDSIWGRGGQWNSSYSLLFTNWCTIE
jgi:hypothetical protein